MQRYYWPGNIRELRNIIERSVILNDDGQLPKDLPEEIQSTAYCFYLLLIWVEKIHIEKVLQHTNGNKTEAASIEA